MLKEYFDKCDLYLVKSVLTLAKVHFKIVLKMTSVLGLFKTSISVSLKNSEILANLDAMLGPLEIPQKE